jgi:hypothetical protein
MQKLATAFCLLPVTLCAQSLRPGQGGPVKRAIATDRDISGVWNFATVTPRERPARFANRPFLTRDEAAALEEEILRAGTQPFASGTALDDGVWSGKWQS